MMTFFIQNNLKLQDWFERFDDVKCLIPNGGNLPISGVPLCLFFYSSLPIPDKEH